MGTCFRRPNAKPTSWFNTDRPVWRLDDLQTTPDAEAKPLEAALRVIRTKGYAATTVDDLCATAGVSKGSFFHHFKSKGCLTLVQETDDTHADIRHACDRALSGVSPN